MDKQTESLARQEFEKWFNEQMVMPIIASNETVVRLMWKAWKASWESLVVVPVNSPELPDGWIPCNERMPEKRGHYLVCTESGLVARSSYSPEHTDYDDVRGCHKLARKDFGKYSRHFEYARASVSKITHWMALPAPPTTEK